MSATPTGVVFSATKILAYLLLYSAGRITIKEGGISTFESGVSESCASCLGTIAEFWRWLLPAC
jgi:hypothetical protein